MSAAHFSAAYPEPFRILGLKLKPLSLGRYTLLNRFGVAFVSDTEQTAGMGDLILGVLICSMRCEEFLPWAESDDFKKDVREWGKQFAPSRLMGKLLGKRWRKKNSFNVVEKIKLFNRYIKEGSSVPKYWDLSENDSTSGSHWAHNVEVALRSELGWTKEEIDEEPLTKALSDYFKYAETQGSVQLMSEDEIHMGESNAAIIEKALHGS